MKSHFEITIMGQSSEGNQQHSVSIDEIAAEERAGKELLGKADGRNLGHCVYLGARHSEHFLERVRWYYLSDEEDAFLRALQRTQLGSIRVEFYGEKP